MGVASWSALARRRLVGQGGLIAAGRAATAGAAPHAGHHAPLVPPISARARWSSSRRLAIAANVPRVAPWRRAGKVHAGSPRRSFIRELENLI